MILLSLAHGYEDCSDHSNHKGLLNALPVPGRRNAHGRLYTLTSGTETIPIVVVKGNAFDQGQAIGDLLAKEIKENAINLVQYYKDQLRDILVHYVPTWMAEGVIKLGEFLLKLALNLTWLLTRSSTPQRYFDELKGMAEGAHVDYMDMVRIAMFPELIKAACSLVGVWGTATAHGEVYFLRTLDWDVNQPITAHPAVIVYHSTEPESIPFATFGYAGLVGSFTAVNAKGLAIGEKVWYPAADTHTETTRAGKPWTFVLRDVAQFASSISKAVEMLTDSARTCSIHVGVASVESQTYRGIYYSWNKMLVFDDHNYTQNDTKHPLLDGVNYWDKTIEPTHNGCIGSLLRARHGSIDPAYLYEEMAPRHTTGNVQVFVFDVSHHKVYFAYSTYVPRTNAYDKPLFVLDTDHLFYEMPI